MLVNIGCDVNARNVHGEPPLVCLDFTEPRTVKVLLEAGADVSVSSSEGESLLQLAIESKNLESVKLMLDTGIDVNHLDITSRSALYYAVRCQLLEVVQELVKHGAVVNRPNSNDKYVRYFL